MLFISSHSVVFFPIVHCSLKVSNEVISDLVILIFCTLIWQQMIKSLQMLKIMREKNGSWSVFMFSTGFCFWFVFSCWILSSKEEKKKVECSENSDNIFTWFFSDYFFKLTICWNDLIFITLTSFKIMINAFSRQNHIPEGKIKTKHWKLKMQTVSAISLHFHWCS